MRGALGLLVQDVVSGVSQQRPVVRVEEHFLRAPVGLALTLRTAGVEEEDVAVTVTGSDVEMVRTPLGIIDSPVTLVLTFFLLYTYFCCTRILRTILSACSTTQTSQQFSASWTKWSPVSTCSFSPPSYLPLKPTQR